MVTKKTRGRVALDGATVKRAQVMLDKETVRRAKALGDGNISMGLRIAVKSVAVKDKQAGKWHGPTNL